jgi:hypothetical protein
MSWLTRLVPGQAPDGGHILSVLAKNTYSIAHQQRAGEDLENPLGWLEADTYWGAGNPAADPVREESDLLAAAFAGTTAPKGHHHGGHGHHKTAKK